MRTGGVSRAGEGEGQWAAGRRGQVPAGRPPYRAGTRDLEKPNTCLSYEPAVPLPSLHLEKLLHVLHNFHNSIVPKRKHVRNSTNAHRQKDACPVSPS